MTDKPNCSTCLHHTIQNGEDHHCIKYRNGSSYRWIPNDEYETISVIGCLSHPGAREWLMKDVIAYMEQFLVSNENTPFDRYEWCDRAKSAMAKEAISLIHGVKE